MQREGLLDTYRSSFKLRDPRRPQQALPINRKGAHAAMNGKPILWIIIPCYNEEAVLPITAPQFPEENPGSVGGGTDQQPQPGLLCERRVQGPHLGADLPVRQTGRALHSAHQPEPQPGHQNAVLAGLMEAKDKCDVTISIDCGRPGRHQRHGRDGPQVPGRGRGGLPASGAAWTTDTFFKRFTAEGSII